MSERFYHDQFVAPNDLMIVAIPQREIVKAMACHGEHETLNDVCLAVAVVAEAIDAAQAAAVR